MKKTVIILMVIMFWGSEKASGQTSALKYGVSYTGDLVNNSRGGIKHGSIYLGMANLSLSWGGFFLNAVNTHGGRPSGELIGDFQGVSNIEAGSKTYLQELWYRQNIGDFSVIAGLQDLGTEFAVSEYSALFLNGSFGVHSTLTHNVPAPVFPYSTPGLQVHWKASEKSLEKLAVFNGQSGDGILLISEFSYTSELINGMPGTIKAGAYYHNHKYYIDELPASDEIPLYLYSNNYGLYFVADQVLSKNENGGKLVAFSQLGLSPYQKNENDFYLGAGLCYYGIFEDRAEDAVGIAAAHAGFSERLRRGETTIELNYSAHITGNIFIQPDIQYVINPAGTADKLPDTLAGIVRFGVNF